MKSIIFLILAVICYGSPVKREEIQPMPILTEEEPISINKQSPGDYIDNSEVVDFAGFVNYEKDQNEAVVVQQNSPKDTMMTVFESFSKSSSISTSSKPSAAPDEDNGSSNDTPSDDPGLVDYAGIL